MFERFTASARTVVIHAQEESRGLGHRHIGSEHLLLALLQAEEGDAARTTLEEFGLTYDDARSELERLAGSTELDAEALRFIGVDLEQVRRQVEDQFGAGALDESTPTPTSRWLRRSRFSGGAIPFTDDAKMVLELSLRESIALQSRAIRSGHILLGLLRAGSGLGYRILENRNVPVGPVRTRLGQRLRASA